MKSTFQDDGVISRMFMSGSYATQDSMSAFLRLLETGKDGKLFGMILVGEDVQLLSSYSNRVPMQISMGKLLSTLSGALAVVCKTDAMFGASRQFQNMAGAESKVRIEVFRDEARAEEWIVKVRERLLTLGENAAAPEE